MAKTPKSEDLLDILKDLQKRVHNLERSKTEDLVIREDKKIYLDGEDKSTYLVWNSASSQLRIYVNNTLEGYIDSSNTGTRLLNS